MKKETLMKISASVVGTVILIAVLTFGCSVEEEFIKQMSKTNSEIIRDWSEDVDLILNGFPQGVEEELKEKIEFEKLSDEQKLLFLKFVVELKKILNSESLTEEEKEELKKDMLSVAYSQKLLLDKSNK